MPFLYGILFFQIKFGKYYKENNNGGVLSEEESMRKLIFIENLKKVTIHNRRYRMGLETYTQGINEFSDMTFEEFAERIGMKVENNLQGKDNCKNKLVNE